METDWIRIMAIERVVWRPTGSVLLYVDDVQRSYGRLGGLLRLACTHWRYDHWWSLERSSGGVCVVLAQGASQYEWVWIISLPIPPAHSRLAYWCLIAQW